MVNHTLLKRPKLIVPYGNRRILAPQSLSDITGLRLELSASQGVFTDGAAKFNGTDAYLSRASEATLQIGDVGMVWAGWVKWTASTSRIFLAKDDNASSREYLASVNGSTQFDFSVSSNGTALTTVTGTSPSPLVSGTWYWLVLGHDSVANKIWLSVNGGVPFYADHTGGIFSGTAPLELGGRSAGGSYFNGSLDSLVFYKTTLPRMSTLLTWLYNSGNGRVYADIISSVNYQGAGSFDTSDQSTLSLTSHADFQVGGESDFYLCGFARLRDNTNLPSLFGKWGVGQPEWEIHIQGGLKFGTYVGSNDPNLITNWSSVIVGSDPAADTWFFYEGWYNSAERRIYASRDTSDAIFGSVYTHAGPTSGAEPVTISGSFGGTGYLQGLQDSVAFFKGGIPQKALRKWFYNSGAGRAYSDLPALVDTQGAGQFSRLEHSVLQIASNASLQIGDTDWALCGFFKTSDITIAQGILGKWGSTQEYALELSSSTLVAHSGENSASVSNLVSATWHFFVLRYFTSSNEFFLEVDGGGVARGYDTDGPPVSTSKFCIGSLNGYNQFFDGFLESFALYKGGLPHGGILGYLRNSGNARSYRELPASTNVQSAAQFVSVIGTRISVANAATLNTAGLDFEICGFVKLPTFTAGKRVAGKGTSPFTGVANWSWELSLENTERLKFAISDGTTAVAVYLINEDTPPGDVWYFIDCWYVHSETKAYIAVNRGTPVVSAAQGGNGAQNHSGALDLGSFGGQTADCVLDSWGYRIGSLFSESDRDFLYNNGNGRAYADLLTAHKTDMVAWYDFNRDNANGLAHDSHGTHHGTHVGVAMDAPGVPGATDGTADPKENLVSWWDFNKEATNGMGHDSHGTNHLSNPTLPAQQASGKLGNAVEIVPADEQHVWAAHTASLATDGGHFSVGGWGYVDTTTDDRPLVSKDDETDHEFSLVPYYQSATLPRFIVGSTVDDGEWGVSAGSFPGTATWMFLVGTFRNYGGNRQAGISLDGGATLYSPQTTDTPTVSNGDFKVGRSEWLDAWLDGRADGVFFYQGRVATVSEIKALHRGGVGRSWSTLPSSIDVKGAATFDGTSTQYLSKTDHADFEPGSGSFEASGWVKFQATGHQVPFGKYASTGSQRSWLLEHNSTGPKLMFYLSSNGTSTTSVTANNYGNVSTNKWMYAQIWYDADSDVMHIKVDDTLPDVASFAGPIFNSTAKFAIGNRSDESYPTTGQEDSVAVWNGRYLSASERHFLYNGGLGKAYSQLPTALPISTGARFDVNSSYSLSHVDDAHFEIADDLVWFSLFFYAESITNPYLVSKFDDPSNREYWLWLDNGTLKWEVSGDGSGSTASVNISNIAANKWYHVDFGHDPTANNLWMRVNDGTKQTSGTISGGAYQGTSAFYIGRREEGNYFTGVLSQFFFGRSPTASVDTIATRLYNNGKGLSYADLTDQEKSDWGLSSAYEFNYKQFLLDSHANYHLTSGNNTPEAHVTSLQLSGGTDLEESSSQFYSVADSASVSMGDIDCWWAGWYKPESVGALRTILSKFNTTGDQREYLIQVDASNQIHLHASSDGTSGNTSDLTSGFGTVAADKWYFVLGWHDSVRNTINLRVNQFESDSLAHTGGVFDGTSDFRIGAHHAAGEYADGVIDQVCFGKSPTTSIDDLIGTIHKRLYNSGKGLRYDELTAAEKAAWGLVSFYEFESGALTTDAHGSNTLTNNGTATATDGVVPTGSAANFNGADQYFSASHDASLAVGSNDAWIAGWMYDVGGGLGGIISKWGGSSTYEWDVRRSAGGALEFFAATNINGSTYSSVLSSTLTQDVWTFFLAWIDTVSQTINIRLDDGSVASASYTTDVPAGTSGIEIGRIFGSGDYFLGKLENVIVGVNPAAPIAEIIGKIHGTLYNNRKGIDHESIPTATHAVWGTQAWWDFDDGATTTDKEGSNTLTNNGSIVNVEGMPRLADSQAYAAEFNGSSDYMSLADNASLNLGDQRAFWGGWFSADITGAWQFVFGKYNSGSNLREWGLWITNTDIFRAVMDDVGDDADDIDATNFGAISANTRYFVLAWYDPDTDLGWIQVNDALPESAAHTGGFYNGTAPFTIGVNDGGSSYFDGSADSVFFGKGGYPSPSLRDFLYNDGKGRNYDALPAVISTRGAAQFDSSLSQYLSIADNTDFSVGDVDVVLAAQVKLSSKAAVKPIAGKWGSGTTQEYLLLYDNTADRFRFQVSDTGSNTVTVDADDLGSPSVDTFYSVVAWHDATNNTIKIDVNDQTTPDSTAHTAGIFDSTSDFRVGSYQTTYFDGSIDSVGWFKSPSGGVDSKIAAIKTALYNSGNGLAYQKLTSTQKTDWGLLSFYDFPHGHLGFDSHGANNLTANGNPTEALGVAHAFDDFCPLKSAKFVRANSEYLDVSDGTFFQGTDRDFSGSIAFKVDQLGINQTIMGRWESGNSRREWYLIVNSSDTIRMSFSSDGDTGTNIGSVTAQLNKWYIATFYHNASTDEVGLSINGAAFETTAFAGGVNGSSSNKFRVGVHDASSNYTDGQAMFVRLWDNYVVTQNDVDTVYNNGKGRKHSELIGSLSSTLAGSWDCTEDSGDRADSVASNDLTDNNSVLNGPGLPRDLNPTDNLESWWDFKKGALGTDAHGSNNLTNNGATSTRGVAGAQDQAPIGPKTDLKAYYELNVNGSSGIGTDSHGTHHLTNNGGVGDAEGIVVDESVNPKGTHVKAWYDMEEAQTQNRLDATNSNDLLVARPPKDALGLSGANDVQVDPKAYLKAWYDLDKAHANGIGGDAHTNGHHMTNNNGVLDGAGLSGASEGTDNPQTGIEAAYDLDALSGPRLDSHASLDLTANGSLGIDTGVPAGEAEDNETVKLWVDQSGQGNDATQSTAAKKPTLQTNIVGGHAAIEFDGVDDWVSATVGASANRTTFIVARRIGPYVSSKAVLGYGDVDAHVRDSNTEWIYNANQAAGTESIGGTPTDWQIITINFTSASNAELYIDGMVQGTFDPHDDFSTGTDLFIGSQFADSALLNCQVTHVVEYSPSLTLTDIQRVTKYLAEQLGLSLLF